MCLSNTHLDQHEGNRGCPIDTNVGTGSKVHKSGGTVARPNVRIFMRTFMIAIGWVVIAWVILPTFLHGSQWYQEQGQTLDKLKEPGLMIGQLEQASKSHQPEKLTREQVIEIVRKAQGPRTSTWRGRADLRGLDLSGLDLSGVDLRGANLARANLTGANLSKANLRFKPREFPRVDLTGADLTEANLNQADLSGANLARANLRRANLRGARLRRAGDRPVLKTNLRYANLMGANLAGADLRGADLGRADLTGAVLIGARLTRGSLDDSVVRKVQMSDEAWRLYTPPFVSDLLGQAKKFTKEGQIAKALLLFEIAEGTVQKHDPPLRIQASSWNTLCWYGSLHGHAADVMDACDRAVELDGENGGYRDSRGLARALTGDTQGAIEDFKFYVAWGPQHAKNEKAIKTRQKWIRQLMDDQNPFDSGTLEELR